MLRMRSTRSGIALPGALWKKLSLLTALFLSASLSAQMPIDMADQFRTDGKIRVVIAVIAIIFIGLIVYMIRLDKRLRNLEKDHSQT